MYQDILLPTDGSIGMASAIEQGLYQAHQSGAKLHVLYVIDIRAFIMLPEQTQAQVVALLEQEGQTAIDYVSGRASEQGVDVVATISQGVPHETILEYATEHSVDLIVMGTHGRTGEMLRAVGSVAEEVVRSASMPVLTVKKQESDVPDDDTLNEAVEEVPVEQTRYIS